MPKRRNLTSFVNIFRSSAPEDGTFGNGSISYCCIAAIGTPVYKRHYSNNIKEPTPTRREFFSIPKYISAEYLLYCI